MNDFHPNQLPPRKERRIIFPQQEVIATLDGRKCQFRRVVKQPDINLFSDSWKSAYEDGDGNWIFWSDDSEGHTEFTKSQYPKGCNKGIKCPFGQVGDRLWVAETFWQWGYWFPSISLREKRQTQKGKTRMEFVPVSNPPRGIRFDRPDEQVYQKGQSLAIPAWHKRPSIFLPREASRITLEITNVRVKRLQDISEEDAIAEGIESQIGFARLTWYRDYITQVPSGDFLGVSSAKESFKTLWQSINAKQHPWESNPWVWVVNFSRLED